MVLYLALSKYGNIRLGEGKPQYSTLAWLFMFICAGLARPPCIGGDGMGVYYQTPGLNIAPRTPKALEYSISYSFSTGARAPGPTPSPR
ncbi:BCCT family transporter [Serratia ureilytica]